MKKILSKFPLLVLTLMVGLMAASSAYADVKIIIENGDPTTPTPIGFNDPTPVAPIGGNPGTTLGQQRLIAFQTAADIWGATLNSNNNQTILVRATWEELSCGTNSAVLGSAGPTSADHDFPGAIPGFWYPASLVNAITGVDSNTGTASNPTGAEIRARFNIKLGETGCFDGHHWYLGLDGNHGADVDLLTVLLHEFSHGLGFLTLTSNTTGKQFGNTTNGFLPSIFDRFLKDNTTGKTWAEMNDAERVASAINTGNLVWNGPQAKADSASVLGTPHLRVNSPALGTFDVGTAVFGPPVSASGLTGSVVRALDAADSAGPSTTDGCSAINNPGAVAGKIALVDRGICNFTVKVKNAQDAGAIGVIVADISGATTPQGMGGVLEPTITIPSVFITTANGSAISNQLASGGNVSVTMFLDRSQVNGVDGAGNLLMYAPGTVSAGSSVSHWDTSLSPNQLMEPNNSSDLTHGVALPRDVTLSLLKDIGWSAASTTPTPTPTPVPTPTPTPTPIPTPTPVPTPVGNVVEFSSASYGFNEGTINTPQGFGALNVSVSRGNNAAAATVQFATFDTSGGNECNQVTGLASQRCDYTQTAGTLRFAAGESTKTIQIPIVNDGYLEGNEGFFIKLQNPVGVSLGTINQATITISDDSSDSTPTTGANNPYLNNGFFVRMNYADFLSREPDTNGFSDWTGVLNNCGSQKGFLGAPFDCDRAHVSHGFFGSPEFTNTGFLIYRLYAVGMNRLPRYSEFTPDMASLSGFGLSNAVQQQNLSDYLQQFTAKTEFTTRFSDSLLPSQAATLIQKLEQTAGVTLPATATTLPGQPTQYGRQELINLRANGTFTVGQTLKAFVEQQGIYDGQFNAGEVTMMYFAYLKRDPDLNDPNLLGWKEWVFVFTNGGAQRGRPDIAPRDIHHLIFGFIYSEEYRRRFGAP